MQIERAQILGVGRAGPKEHGLVRGKHLVPCALFIEAEDVRLVARSKVRETLPSVKIRHLFGL